MTLDVLISTCRPAGIEHVAAMDLPVVEDVTYIVTWQDSRDTPVPPALEQRKDIEIYRVDTIGLSNNRNEGISRSRGDIWLVADDDLRYTAPQLRKVIDTFRSRPAMDVALFRFEGAGSKLYPAVETPAIPYPKFYYPSSVEIAVRRSPRTMAMRFDPRFGLGSGLFHAGEEDIFLLRGRELGLDMRIIPETITLHQGVSTGEGSITDGKVLAAFGAVMRYHYPLSFILRLPLKAWRLSRAGRCGFMRGLARMSGGALYTLFKLPAPWKS